MVKQCTIKDFRDVVATAADVMNMKKDHFNLVIDVSGDPEFVDTYGLQIFNGKGFRDLHIGSHDLCEIIDILKDAIKIELEKKEKKK